MSEPFRHCFKCSRGLLLPVDRVVDLGYNPMPEELAKKLGYGLSVDALKDLLRHLGTVRIWKCSNPECDHEVK